MHGSYHETYGAFSCASVFFFFGLQLLVGGGVGYLIGNSKGLGGVGFALGAFLGLIGWIIVALIPGQAPQSMMRRRLRPSLAPAATGLKPCPYCAEPIQRGARLCRFCRSSLG